MIHNKYMAIGAFCISALLLLISLSGCGEDVGAYQSEVLTFETPVANKTVKQKAPHNDRAELDLVTDDVSNWDGDWNLTRLGAYIPWIPYPVYDYYLQPIPVAVPVTWWGYSVVDFVHPFYGFTVFDQWGDEGDDDEGFVADDE